MPAVPFRHGRDNPASKIVEVVRELLAEGKIQRIGESVNRDPFRYFGRGREDEDRGTWRAPAAHPQVG